VLSPRSWRYIHGYGLAEIKGSIKDYNLKLEQIKFDRVKNFEYFRSKGFSLEAAFSKAECIVDKDYAQVSKETAVFL
jgi:hypothetical protein